VRHCVRIDEIPATGMEYLVDEAEPVFRKCIAEAVEADGDHRCSVRVSVTRQEQRIELGGSMELRALLSCSRCLAEVPFDTQRAVHAVLLLEVPPLEEDAEIEETDLDESYFDGEELDLMDLIREQLILALPDKPLCDEECKGLCPQCGADRNVESCGCDGKQPDPRMAVLATLKIDAES